MANDVPSSYDRLLLGGVDSTNRNEATIQSLLDMRKQLSKELDNYLFSAEKIEETYDVVVEKRDLVTGEVKKVIEKRTRERYRRLPNEEQIISCRMLEEEKEIEVNDFDYDTHELRKVKVKIRGKIDCHARNVMPDQMLSYPGSLDPDIFEGFCVVFTQSDDGSHIPRLERFRKHLKEVHHKDIETEYLVEDLIHNSTWLTWNAMFNNLQGFEAVKNYILIKVAPISSTTIIPDKKNRFGMDSDEVINNEAADTALLKIQDVIMRHRDYGFDQAPTKIRELNYLIYDLDKHARQRNINGILLRGIISSVEERKVNITQETVGGKNEGNSSIFGKIINRGN